MLITLLFVALVVAFGLAAIECVLLVALMRQIPRWRWQLLCFLLYARYASLLFRVRTLWVKMQCHMHPMTLSSTGHETQEQSRWTWTEMADAIRMALASDITVFCHTEQEVAA
jgi:hypothetical protein